MATTVQSIITGEQRQADFPTQELADQGFVPAGPQVATPATPAQVMADRGDFNVSLPENIPTTALEKPVTKLDIQSELQKNLSRQDDILGQITAALQPTERETQLTEQIQAGDIGIEKQAIALQNQPILTAIATGQERVARQLNALDRQTLINELSNAQATRQTKLQAAQILYDAQRNRLKDTVDFYQATAPDSISTQIDDATGDIIVVTRNPLTGEVSSQRTAGLTPAQAKIDFVSKQTMTDPQTGQLTFVGLTSDGEVVRQSLGVEGEEDLTTQVRSIGGRQKLITYDASGNLINEVDLGSSRSGGGGGGGSSSGGGGSTIDGLGLTKSQQRQSIGLGIDSFPLELQLNILEGLSDGEARKFVRAFENEQQARQMSIDPADFFYRWVFESDESISDDGDDGFDSL